MNSKRKLKYYQVIALLLLLYSCQDSPTDNQHTSDISEIKNVRKELKSVNESKQDNVAKASEKSQLITNINVEKRLLEYGKNNPETIALIETDKGNIKIRLYKDTPLHRASFVLMAKNGCYDNIVFTRVAKDFMAQAGGSYDEKVINKRNSIGSYTIPAEISRNHIHKQGAVGAARSYVGNPDKRSNPYNFYFIEGTVYNDLTLDNYEQTNNYKYNDFQREFYIKKPGAAHIDGQHTVFGEIIEGYEVVPKITSVKRDSRDWPVTDIFIKKVTMIK